MNMTTPEAASPLPLKGATPAAWQSRFRGVRLAGAFAAVTLSAGCAAPQPWVKPHERERLADPIMQWQGDLLAAKHSQHVRDIREGARGAVGVQGGGCGCK
jgi:Domain of unknown function (DUF4266)